MDLLTRYLKAVETAITNVSKGSPLGKELESLEGLQSELRSEFAALLRRPDPAKAAQKYSASARQLRDSQVFQLSFMGGGEVEHVTGYGSLANRLALNMASIRVYLSRGNGHFQVKRNNPTTGEPDILQITRLQRQGAPTPRRGRPPKQLDLERLGT